LNGFSHTFLGDLEIAVVGPAGQKFVLMGLVGGSFRAEIATVTFDDAAPTGILSNANLLTGSYKPTSNTGFAAAFPSPAPAGPYQLPALAGTATLNSVFHGANPNGTWSLYINDRASSDTGRLSGGWSISITNSITAQNSQAIQIPDSGVGSLYPSTVTVSGLIGSVTSTLVVLDGLSHTLPDDVDVLLVAPGGRSVVLMSDVGGATPVNNVVIGISDDAASRMPDDGPLVTGSYLPTDISPGDTFPAPAPGTPPTGTTLATFNGINPNGVWSLYLVDDNGNNAGSISTGWGLGLATSTSSCSLNLTPTIQAFPITGGNGTFDVNTPFGCDWTAASISDFVDITSPSNGSGGTQPITFSVEPNMLGARTGRIKVSNSGVERTFTIQQPSGCPFSLNQETMNFASSGGAGNVQVTAVAACGWTPTTTDNWITINSGTGSGNGVVDFTVAANPSVLPRTGTIVIGARLLTITQERLITPTRFDFDGDFKADLAVFRPADGAWHISNSSSGTQNSQFFGLGTDRIAPSDFDGDGKTDIAVFRNGVWYILQSTTGVMRSEQWGVAGDVPVPADYDGDGKTDVAIWRESNGAWYAHRSSDLGIRSGLFGVGGDKPVAGDYDHDGLSDFAVFRPSTQTWYVLQTSNNSIQGYLFGQSTDRLVPADYDGDGKTDIAVFRASQGSWFIQQTTAGFISRSFGLAGDVPVPADYDGDGKADIAVFRQGSWYVLQSTTGVMRSEHWGTNGDAAAESAFVSN
jgi:subtilisin-like proprotein convertase family protein